MTLLRIACILLLIAISCIVHVFPLLLVAVVKAVLPFDGVRRAANPLLTGIAESWIGLNNAMIRAFTDTRIVVEGDIDLRGLLGLDPEVRNGFSGIRVAFRLRGDDPDALREVLDRSIARSAVLDVLTHGLAVSIDADVDAG